VPVLVPVPVLPDDVLTVLVVIALLVAMGVLAMLVVVALLTTMGEVLTMLVVVALLLLIGAAEAVEMMLVVDEVCAAVVLVAEPVEPELPEPSPHPLSAAATMSVADIKNAWKFCDCKAVTSWLSVRSNSAWVHRQRQQSAYDHTVFGTQTCRSETTRCMRLSVSSRTPEALAGFDFVM
jgi:hypothetical protein